MSRLSHSSRSLIPAIAVALLVTAPASAMQSGEGRGGAASVSGVGQSQEIDCGGRVAQVSGTDNVVTFTGDCAGLKVSGVDNQVSVNLRPGASISVSGSGNQVGWRSAGKVRPRVAISGVDNRVRAAP